MNKLISILLSLLISSAPLASRLPDLGDPSQNILNTKEMAEMKNRFIAELQNNVDVITDPAVSAYINQLGDNLVLYSTAKKQGFHFIVIAADEINAFAGPANIIGINSGLFLATKSESELAAVIAHEISHISQRHLLRSIAKAKHLQIPMILAAVAAIAIGTQSGDLGSGALMAGMAGFQQDMINFTRAHEKEADRIGIDILYRAKHNPNSMAVFFQRMYQQERLYFSNSIAAILRTHPVTPSRIADAENRSAKMRKRHYSSSLQYKLIQARIRVLTAEQTSIALRYFAQQLKKSSSTVTEYGYALSLLNLGKPHTAKKWIAKLVEKNKEEVLYRLLEADYYTDIKNYAAAISVLKNTLYIYPDNYPLIIQYGRTLLIAKQAQQAESFLQKIVYRHPDDISYLFLLARAQAANKNKAAAYFSQAQAMIISEQTELAYNQLRIAKRLAKRNSYLEKRINALLMKIKSETN